MLDLGGAECGAKHAAQDDTYDALRAVGARRALYHPRRGVTPPSARGAPTGGVAASSLCSASGRACAETAACGARRLAEACDALDGLHISLAAAGGAGAGLGTLVLQELELELGRTPTMVHALFPAPTHGAAH
jgi:tubulin alpha